MNMAVAIVLSAVAITALFIFTFLISFYHCFDPNRESFDRYAVMTITVLAIVFCISFSIVVNWYGKL